MTNSCSKGSKGIFPFRHAEFHTRSTSSFSPSSFHSSPSGGSSRSIGSKVRTASPFPHDRPASCLDRSATPGCALPFPQTLKSAALPRSARLRQWQIPRRSALATVAFGITDRSDIKGQVADRALGGTRRGNTMRRLPILGMLAFVAAFAEPAFAGGQVVELGPPAILQTSDAARAAPAGSARASRRPHRSRGHASAVPPLGPPPAPPAEMPAAPNHGPTRNSRPCGWCDSHSGGRSGTRAGIAAGRGGATSGKRSVRRQPEPTVRRLRNSDPPPAAVPASDSTAGGPQAPRLRHLDRDAGGTAARLSHGRRRAA